METRVEWLRLYGNDLVGRGKRLVREHAVVLSLIRLTGHIKAVLILEVDTVHLLMLLSTELIEEDRSHLSLEAHGSVVRKWSIAERCVSRSDVSKTDVSW